MSKYSKTFYVVFDTETGKIFSDFFYHSPSAYKMIEKVKSYYPHKTFKVSEITWDNVKNKIIGSEFPGVSLAPGIREPIFSSGEEGDAHK